MLSRVADNLYWMSRYLERAEHSARLLDEALHQMLDHTPEFPGQQWQQLRTSLNISSVGEGPDEVYNITQALTFDSSNNASIVWCIDAARENARQVREQISTEMWEQINRLYLQINQTNIEEIWYAEPYGFLKGVKEGVQLFQGITDATMNHSEGWYFIHLGRYIERITATANLMDVHFNAYQNYLQADLDNGLAENADPFEYINYVGWISLLRSCTSFEAYCKVYTANLQPDKIAEFLLLNAELPRSVRFAAAMIQNALQNIARSTNTRHTGRVERLAGRLRAALDYDQVEDIMGNMHAYLENIKKQCAQIHKAIYDTYIIYPIDAALIAEGAAQS